MEIERKFLIPVLPENIETFPFHLIEQGYLNTQPAIRVRRQDDEYYLTYKGSGLMAREEYNLPLSQDAYEHLLPKADGAIIRKKRYLLPLEDGHTAELDVFAPPFAPLLLAEVEFSSIEEAEAFFVPDWFGEEVTYDSRYHNSVMSQSIEETPEH